MRYGGFGEPYCSENCYNQGGKYSAAVMLKEQSGVCGFCEIPVKASMYGVSNCSVIPYEGINLFICSQCKDKANGYLKNYFKCCNCQKII